ncbi:MAG TPA: cell envelope integrity protein TolA [Cellvibrionaceae bacterium]
MKGSRFISLPIVFSLVMHGAIMVLVTWGWEATNEHTPRVFRPQHIEASLIQMTATDTSAAAPAEPERQVIDLTRQRELQREQEEAARRAREAEARRQQQQRDREQTAADKRKREAERKRQEEQQAERRRAEAEQARQQAEREQREAEQRRVEQAEAAEQARQAAELAATQTQSYMAIIRQRIESNWSRPPSARRGMSAELLIHLVPTGQVVSVTVTRSSGDGAFDRAAEQAVRRVDRFSELQQMPPELFEQQFRQVKLIFTPEDLRL